MSHVSLRAIEQSFKFESVRVSIGYHVPHLPYYCGEYEHTNQIADNCKHVSVNRFQWFVLVYTLIFAWAISDLVAFRKFVTVRLKLV